MSWAAVAFGGVVLSACAGAFYIGRRFAQMSADRAAVQAENDFLKKTDALMRKAMEAHNDETRKALDAIDRATSMGDLNKLYEKAIGVLPSEGTSGVEKP